MKRLFKLLVVVIIVMGLCGCGTKKESADDSNENVDNSEKQKGPFPQNNSYFQKHQI